MKHIHKTLTLISAAACAVLFAAGSASADIFTWVFEFPEWDFNTNTDLFGDSPILTINLDNGNSTDENQTYDLATDVVSFDINTVNGTYSNTWLGSDLFRTEGTDTEFITTDSNGVASLDLLVRDPGSSIAFSNASGTWLFGREAGDPTTYLANGPEFGGSASASHSPHDGGFKLLSVPAPGAFALLGVAGLMSGKRRQRNP